MSATFLCLFINNFLKFELFRLLQGLGGSSTGIIAMAIVRDYYSGKSLTQKMATIYSIMMTAPLIAPIVGSALMHYFKVWESIFVFILCYGVAILITACTLKESIKEKSKNKLIDITSYTVHLKNKKFVLLTLIPALGFGSYFVFIGNSSVLLISYFHLTQFEYSLIFGLNVLVGMIVQYTLEKIVDRYKALNIIIVCLIIALFGNALAFYFSYIINNIYLFSLSIILTCGSLSSIGTLGSSAASSAVKESFGTANALNGLFGFIMAGLATYISSMFYGIELMKAISIEQIVIVFSIILIIWFNMKLKDLS